MEPVVKVGPDGAPESLAAARRAAGGAERRGLSPAGLPAWSTSRAGAHPQVEAMESVRLESAAKVVVPATGNCALPVLGRLRHRPALSPEPGAVTQAGPRHARCPVAVVAHD
jgi:hypothetical protein